MKICIDAGHGGTDPGACGCGYAEANLTLELTRKVGEILRNSGLSVVYTRTTDTYVGLQDRCNISNGNSVDYFVSIHFNASNGQGNGIETYCVSTGGKAEKMAGVVQANLIQALGLKNRGVKTANYYILRNTTAPAILIETAFIDNAGDMQVYNGRKDAVATAIANAILNMCGCSQVSATPSQSVPPAPAVAGDYGIVTASALNVRSGAGTGYGVIGQLSNGQKVRIGSRVGGWYDIYFGDHGGWVCADYIRLV